MTTCDLVLASSDQFDAIMADIGDILDLIVYANVSLTIDDVVLVVGSIRSVLDDRPSLRKVQREVYGKFAAHPAIYERTLAMLPDQIRNELSNLDDQSIGQTVSKLSVLEQNPKWQSATGIESLKTLATASDRANRESLSVFLRTPIPPNAFATEFNALDLKHRERFERAFAGWDSGKRYEAHQRFNYYQKQGNVDALNQVLKDFSPSVRKKINLKVDQRAVQRYVTKRITAYRRSANPDSGSPTAPVTMLALLFDIEYEGSVSLIISTLPNAADDPFLVESAEECMDLSHWHDAFEQLTCDASPIKLTLPDGSTAAISPEMGASAYETYLGDMLRETMLDLRSGGIFSKLPLASASVMLIAGPHVDYFWPAVERLHEEGSAHNPSD